MAERSESPAIQFYAKGEINDHLERLQGAAKKAKKMVLYADDEGADPVVSCWIIDEYIVA